jgi:hypothetical protein
MSYGYVPIHRAMVTVSGPSMEKYVREETAEAVQAGRKAFDDANQEVVDNIDWGKVEDALNENLPDGYKAKVSDF